MQQLIILCFCRWQVTIEKQYYLQCILVHKNMQLLFYE